MNRSISLLVALLLLTGAQAFSQVSFKDLFDSGKPLTYLGVDFTQAKVTGYTDTELETMVDKTFTAINNVVLNEPKKYDLLKFFHKSDVQTDISFTEAKNKKISADKLEAKGDDKPLSNADIEKLIKGYSFSGKKGMGVILFFTTMYKVEKAEKGTVYVVFVDMEKNKVLYSEEFTSKPAGFGLRNYWAKIVYNVLEEIGDSKYKKWKKQNS